MSNKTKEILKMWMMKRLKIKNQKEIINSYNILKSLDMAKRLYKWIGQRF